jgi:uncharacterized protein (TIGR02588 family)
VSVQEVSSQDRPRRGPRQLAEWLSFAVSLALVLALAAHLLWRMREPVTDTIHVLVRAQLDEVSEHDGRFILPLGLKNPGARTVRDLQVRIEYRAPGGARESMDVLVDYLGKSAEEVIFAYFSEDPRSLSVHAEPISYRLE